MDRPRIRGAPGEKTCSHSFGLSSRTSDELSESIETLSTPTPSQKEATTEMGDPSVEYLWEAEK